MALLAGLLYQPADVRAQSIQFSGSIQASDTTAPPLEPLLQVGDTNYFAFKNLDKGTAAATVITNFASLAADIPATVTLELGNLELIGPTLVRDPLSVTENFGDTDSAPAYLRVMRNGALVAQSADLTMSLVTVTDPRSGLFNRGVGIGQGTLQTVGDNSFGDELKSLTGGSGLFRLRFNDYTPVETWPLARATDTAAWFGFKGDLFLIPVPPLITRHPQSLAVKEGQRADFSVAVIGKTPYLSFQWTFNGAALAGATNDTFSLAIATAAQAGRYQVLISNRAGTTTSAEASLAVSAIVVPPSITAQPQSLTATNRGTASFSVSAVGSAPLAYQWRFNGTAITGANQPTLTLDNIDTTQAGTYSVVVSNDAGSVASSGATLTVNVTYFLPQIVVHPASQTVTNGADVTFFVTATGSEPLAYQWKWNGMSILGATNASFSLSHVNANQAGYFTVVVANAIGSVTSQIAVLSLGEPSNPPVIFESPASQTIVAGLTATLHCNAGGTPPLHYQWQKNGINLAGQTNASLVLFNAQASDSGAYLVIVSNERGSLASQSANLLVVPPKISQIDFSFSLKISDNTEPPLEPVLELASTPYFAFKHLDSGGGTATGFTRFASLADSTPGSFLFYVSGMDLLGPEISLGSDGASLTYLSSEETPDNFGFYRNGQVIAATDRILLKFTTVTNSASPLWGQSSGVGEAYLKPVAEDPFMDELMALTGGTNLVQIKLDYFKPTQLVPVFRSIDNSAGISGTGQFVVFAIPPVITRQPTNTTVVSGKTAHLSVEAPGKAPFLNYQWKFNGTEIAGANDAILELSQVAMNQAGDYSVVVGNAAGSIASQSAHLTVLPPLQPPFIVAQPVSQSVSNGSTAIFSVAVLGTEPFFYQWKWNDATLAGATNKDLLLFNVSAIQAGAYTVTVANEAGSTTSQPAQLAVVNPPAAPVIITQPQPRSATNGATVTFSVEAAGSEPLYYQWRFNGIIIPNATNSSLVIPSAGVAQTGKYTVVASNLAGTTVSSEASLVVGDPPSLDLAMFAGLTISGTAGARYLVERQEVLGSTTNWITLATVALTNSPLLFIDVTSTNATKRFYRATLAP